MHKACDFTVWKLIKQNLNAAHLWVRSNISTSPLVFSPLLNISSVKSKQLYSRERLLYIPVVLKYPACVFIFTCPRCLIVYHFKLWLSCYLCRGLPKWSIIYQCNPPLYTTVRNTQHFITAQVLGLQSYVPCRGALWNCLDYTMNIMKCDIYGFDRFLKV